ncbi:hypothetical protein F5Y19DRAFT_412735 [Xylariaceae sp. FL1651]|nr:hypothetical protein F5Y19DRAFT_412735 [Xylariaceae sp. FL1651]
MGNARIQKEKSSLSSLLNMETFSSCPQLVGLSSSQRVTSAGARRIRKKGDAFCIRREAEAMEFVRGNTSLPVPAVFEVYANGDKNPAWLTKEELPGRQLGQACQI